MSIEQFTGPVTDMTLLPAFNVEFVLGKTKTLFLLNHDKELSISKSLINISIRNKSTNSVVSRILHGKCKNN